MIIHSYANGLVLRDLYMEVGGVCMELQRIRTYLKPQKLLTIQSEMTALQYAPKHMPTVL